MTMRSTRAATAVERLNTRMGTKQYTMSRTPDGYFFLLEKQAGKPAVKVSEGLEQDAFVTYVNSLGPQKVQRVSKLDQAFEAQLNKHKSDSSQ
jgi:hypothetical protein